MRIAFIGPPGSGKSEMAKLCEAHYGPFRISFADALRAEVAEGFGLRHEQLTDIPKKYQYRELMQVWGATRRKENEGYWLGRFAITALELTRDHPAGNIFVDDCRYPNEYDMLKVEGFHFVRMGHPAAAVAAAPNEMGHESEMYQAGFETAVTLAWASSSENRFFALRRYIDNNGWT